MPTNIRNIAPRRHNACKDCKFLGQSGIFDLYVCSGMAVVVETPDGTARAGEYETALAVAGELHRLANLKPPPTEAVIDQLPDTYPAPTGPTAMTGEPFIIRTGGTGAGGANTWVVNTTNVNVGAWLADNNV